MIKIKEPAVANLFYSGNASELKKQIDGFAKNSCNSYEYKSRAVIVPHAGLVYSGQLAYDGISQLDQSIKNIFIFAPAHRVPFGGIALTTFDEWKTPLGTIGINQVINGELEAEFGGKFLDEAYLEEHSVEIELPIIQTVFKDADTINIIPVLVGHENPKIITKIISKYYPNKECGFVISSDLSHFHNDNKARKIDSETARMIESGDLTKFTHEQACGATGIAGLVDFANQNNYSMIRINMLNSSAVSGDKSRVVGYGTWFLYEGKKNGFIKKYYSGYLLNLCRNVIRAKLGGKSFFPTHAQVFDELGACFVTLKKLGNLRGCIGSIIAHQSLINDIVQNAQNAAFKDPRFNPVTSDEVDFLNIDISLLSEPKQMSFTDEADLLRQIVPFKDGIIIKDGWQQAVYLPSVWEDLPDKELFLKSLKMKAGMSPDHFSKHFEAYRFGTEYIEE